MASKIPKGRTVEALRSVWASIDDLVSELTEEQWALPSPLPGWDVAANVAHIVGTESFLLGERPSIQAVAADHVRNPIGEMNEHWVASLADRPPSEIVETFRDRTARRLEALEAMSQDDWDAVGFTPAGEDAYGRFMQIRVFDCWMHEQDIRAAVGRPGHESGVAVEVSLDEMTTALGFVVGKRAGAPAGSSVTFELTGDAARTIHVAVEERARVVDRLDGPATCTLTMPVIAFSRLAGGRLDAPQHLELVAVAGDRELGQRVLDHLAYTI